MKNSVEKQKNAINSLSFGEGWGEVEQGTENGRIEGRGKKKERNIEQRNNKTGNRGRLKSKGKIQK